MGEPVEGISAVTLLTADMAVAVAFYRHLGFQVVFGGPETAFTSLRAGPGFLNLQLDRGRSVASPIWGRTIFWVDDVDTAYERALAAGLRPEAPPADAPWGERFFHLRDPDGHEMSFARPH
jgi:catechol 2,3-dioxygenase-like lactoylglutathione lyase family enzyme